MFTMAELIAGYLERIQKFEPLSFEAEQKLAKRWKSHKDPKAFSQLMHSYLRLVVKVAVGYKGYGLPLEEMIQEGNLGLMQAIERFDAGKGFRLSTYAMWWIKAHIQEYILNNWSMVKIGTSSTQKKLFFNLRRLKAELLGENGMHLSPEALVRISEELNVSVADVVGMDQRLRHGDESLNAPVGGDEDAHEWQDFIPEHRPNQEDAYSRRQIVKQRHGKLMAALDTLDGRERDIFVARHLTDKEQLPTLEELSDKFGVSRERVRQLEARAMGKVTKFMQRGLLN
ncbi:MAG: sigma-70 family RNA polymerase sigma factor [Proteobacteria bacterium]|nr:sigma-70 family RNA polymerase sigma factor [Pseudomonadota bacterium]